MDGQRNPSSAIPMIPRFLLPADEAVLEIRAGAEHSAIACDDDALHAIVDVEDLESRLHLAHDGVGEGIVVLRAVELEDDCGRNLLGGLGDVMAADLGVGEGRVGRGERELFDV